MSWKRLLILFQSLFKWIRPPRGFRLTKAGRIFFAFLVAIIVVAMLTGNNLLFLVLSVMLAFMIVSGIESEQNIKYLEIDRSLPSEIFARRSVKICYAIKNTRCSSSRLIISETCLHNQVGSVKAPYLSKNTPELFYNKVFFEQRGKTRLEHIKVFTAYPYGLFEKSITFKLGADIIVFPTPLPCSDLLGSGWRQDGHGADKDLDAISHIRAYIPGDSLSSIAWKKQHTSLTTRVIEGGSGGSGIVVVLPGPDIETKLGKATFIILEFFNKGLKFGLCINEYFSGLDSSRTHKIEILNKIACVEAISDPKWSIFDADTDLIYI
ncbi:MAG: hypothetical protein J7L53_09415 [Deltaproteobacteria bacterium]|nr:hypothetical protein [Deltaproteobacteria bacterium]